MKFFDFVFTNHAKKQFLLLEIKIQERILAKLRLIKNNIDSFFVFKPIKNLLPATHSIRIGAYRLLVKIDRECRQVIILKVAHRRDVYRP